MPNRNSTSTPVTRKMSSGPLWAVAALALALVGAIIFGVSQREEPRGSVDALDGDPAFVVPSPSAVPSPQLSTERRQLTLALDLPALSDRQRDFAQVVAVMPRCPLCVGLDKPAIPFSDNEAVLWTALIYTECSFEPYDEYGNFKVNEIGARGCGQLMGGLVTEENMWNVNVNLYDAAREFRRLIDTSGDVMEAIRSYKGVATADTTWQANSIFDVIRVQG